MAELTPVMVDKDYEVIGPVGEGSFGKVYKAQDKRTGDAVAVKQIKLGARSWDEACRSTELQALRSLRHPFIVRLRELIRSQRDGGLYYVFEFVDSDLSRLVKLHPDGMEEPVASDPARQLFAGLAHMHQHNFFHRDLKPENILFDSVRETIRIADFGQARSLRARPPFTDYVGTRWYRAPECLLRDGTYSSPVDIWSSGLIVAELLRGSPLFCGTSSIDQLSRIFQVLGRDLADWPDFARLAQAMRFRAPQAPGCGMQRLLPRLSQQAEALLTEVLTLNPRRRPRAAQCLEHVFFANMPPWDVERLDTHRSRVSRETEDAAPPGKPASIVDADNSANDIVLNVPEKVVPQTSITVDAPDLEGLDAELDKILGDSNGENIVTPIGARASPPYFSNNDDASSVASLPLDASSIIILDACRDQAGGSMLDSNDLIEGAMLPAAEVMERRRGNGFGDGRLALPIPMAAFPADAMHAGLALPRDQI